jgi:hypothetical protein
MPAHVLHGARLDVGHIRVAVVFSPQHGTRQQRSQGHGNMYLHACSCSSAVVLVAALLGYLVCICICVHRSGIIVRVTQAVMSCLVCGRLVRTSRRRSTPAVAGVPAGSVLQLVRTEALSTAFGPLCAAHKQAGFLGLVSATPSMHACLCSTLIVSLLCSSWQGAAVLSNMVCTWRRACIIQYLPARTRALLLKSCLLQRRLGLLSTMLFCFAV